ncbi:acyltransferase family protein [Sediminibacterium ginsengisoli]|uniref:Peptidoglycan/LPS O-acetylase OafA/YrhL, contains acyltransferase and SGNH-hydrolase domains n=1 Tax=Sediminibacterium ginsengisoli TaxID=413434 RepID=A0A1T4Q572_9BACT|nr:acyltransferase [Sediminibacterium ginsengisoli]SJZ98912.1 Peptidoglycan/LPS O-acetylase OafA/YrhL, contains acyltransferase and SGNH-hydrolase domains [Sediminibacterium ginsengisoli]
MRSQGIDFLRFIAVALVLFRHFDTAPDTAAATNLATLVQPLQRIGWIGVDLFFVISGFLISRLVFNELDERRSFNARRFLIRRGFKIYPSFYILIGLTFVLFFLKHKLDTGQLFAELFYYQNYVQGLWPHTWSLAIEEHFYFLIAFVFYIVGKKKINYRSDSFIFIFFVLILLINYIKFSYRGVITDSNRVPYYTHTRIDGLLWGCILAYLTLYKTRVIRFWEKWIMLPFAAAAIPFIYAQANKGISDVSQLYFGFTFFSLYSCNLLLIVLKYESVFKWKLFAAPASVGVFSYSIYLWHMPCKFWIMGAINKLVNLSYLQSLLVYIFSAILVGVVLSKLIEIPFLKIRNRIFS